MYTTNYIITMKLLYIYYLCHRQQKLLWSGELAPDISATYVYNSEHTL